MGFGFSNDDLQSKHPEAEAQDILNDISHKVSTKVITTRKNRGQIVDVLDASSQKSIESNKKKPLKKIAVNSVNPSATPAKKQSRRTKKKEPELFNGTLYLTHSNISDLNRDVSDLYKYYCEKKASLSQYFPSLIRMSLRLLTEAAASDKGLGMDAYLKSNFKAAKKQLDQDAKTTLSTQNVTEQSIVPLLHIGAHNYQAANNIDQTIALSIILGQILTITHGR